MILPVVYKSYYEKPIENPGLEEKDNFAVMLNNINDKQHASNERKRQEAAEAIE